MVYGTPSNALRRERTIRFKFGLTAARQNAETTNLSYLIRNFNYFERRQFVWVLDLFILFILISLG
jgi:hypothetical protein